MQLASSVPDYLLDDRMILRGGPRSGDGSEGEEANCDPEDHDPGGALEDDESDAGSSDSEDDDDDEGRIGDFDEETEPKAPWPDYIFCPKPHRSGIQRLAMLHFVEHPLFPNQRYKEASSEDIWRRQVLQMYMFCKQRNLREVWAYLWTTSYQRLMWKLWACASNPGRIPRLRTTMTAENSWKFIKHHVLSFQTRPRIDQAIFVIITIALPHYQARAAVLGQRFNDARVESLNPLQIETNKSWKKLLNRSLGTRTYKTDLKTFTCDCGGQSLQAQGLCKHLVQLAGAPPPLFFAWVHRRRTQPIYRDQFLKNTSEGDPASISDGDDDLHQDPDSPEELPGKRTHRAAFGEDEDAARKRVSDS
jgi:hypothetical protein